MSSDIISDAYPISLLQEVITLSGVYNGTSVDTTNPVSLLSASIFSISLDTGDFVLTFEDSDDNINFDPLPEGKTIGSATLSSQTSSLEAFASIGCFGTRRYVRPVVTASVPVPAPESRSLSGIVNSTVTATATLAAPFPLVDGDTVTISGANEAPYNGTFVIFNVTGDDFDYTMLSDPAASATGTLLALCPSDDPRGATVNVLGTRKTEILDDFRSNVNTYLFGSAVGINTDGDYNVANFDTTTADGGMGFFLGAVGLTDGVYTTAFDESDDEGTLDPWTEVDPNKILVGAAETSADMAAGDVLSRTGIFGTKKWIRVRIVATNVTTGAFAILVFSDFASNILPSEPL